MLTLKGVSGSEIPYYGYVEITLTVPELQEFTEDVPLLVVPDTPYNVEVPVILGVPVIDLILKRSAFSPHTSNIWKRTHVGRTLGTQTSLSPNPLNPVVKTTKDIELAPDETRLVKGYMKIEAKAQRLHVMVESLKDTQLPAEVTCSATYGEVHTGSKRVAVCLRNVGSQSVKIPAHTKIAQMQLANAVPEPMYMKPNQDEDPVEKLPPELDLTGLDMVSDTQKQQALEVLEAHQHLFSRNPLDLGKTDLVKHKIQLTDPTPIKDRYRRIPPQMYDSVREHLQEMLDMGAIRASHSPWASAVVLAKKKDGGLRFCLDLRNLNSRTVKDAYSLPRIDESLDCLRGSKWFSSLDLKCGYWQVEMDEESKPYTAFTVGPLGFFECERMPFGLVNAPATFQRLMENCLGELHLQSCIIYLDDVIVFSETFEEHLIRLNAVLQKFASAGLKLKPSKCELFKQAITYLGHVVSKDGVATCQNKIQSILDWPEPTTVTEVRSYLGFVGYYRKFIPKFGLVARHLIDLTTGENAKRGSNKIHWTPECQEAFDKLKQLCTQAPILAYPDFHKPFKLYVDASGIGLGASLYQSQDEGPDRVIAYASRSLTKSEAKYPAHKLEFLALKWAVTSKFHEYLYGSTFTVYTDNNPLTYILTTAKLDATGQRWVAALAPYQFTLKYRSGKLNIDADALSRIAWETDNSTKDTEIDPEGVQALLDKPVIYDAQMEVWLNHTVAETKPTVTNVREMLEADWKEVQDKDPVLGAFKKLMRHETPCFPILDPRREYDVFTKRRGDYRVRKGVLYRKVVKGPHQPGVMQLVLPPRYRTLALYGCHDEVGHPAHRRALSILQDRFYWPGMSEDCKQHISSCSRCVVFKSTPQQAPMQVISCTKPLELVHMDYLTIEDRRGQNVNILIVTDHFTRFAQAYVTTSQTAKVTAKTLWDKFISCYGFPDSFLSDQGRNFESHVITELCQLANVKKIRTTPYHPMTNGQCERFNRTLISMIGTLKPQEKSNWREYVKPLVFAYNATRNEATGFSPYYLMFGRNPRLPVDVTFGLPLPHKGTELTTEYVKNLKKQMEWAKEQAHVHTQKQGERNKKNKDQKCRGKSLEPGDKVLVRVTAHTGKHKIQDKWESTIYTVEKQPYRGIPVYQVKPDGDGRIRTLHRNLLLPIGRLD